MIGFMDDLYTFMATTEATLSDFGVRITALEKAITQLPGAVMEQDPSKLPVVIIETSPGTQEVPANGND